MDKNLEKSILRCVNKYPEIDLLMLFGSRARKEARENSDWDFGYMATGDFDSAAFYCDLVLLLGTDKVDLVNLSSANGLLRFRVARDGIVLFEKKGNEHKNFWYQAVNFWCDASPIIRAEYNAIFGGLK